MPFLSCVKVVKVRFIWLKWGGGGGFAIDIIIYSGMLNNLSFQYLLIRAEKPKKIQKTLISLYEPDKRIKGGDTKIKLRCACAQECLIWFFFLTICSHLLAFCSPSCQSSKLLCICDHREYRSIVYRSVLNYSCHWAPNLCHHWSGKQNMKRIGVAIWWPTGQGDFNIGIIERGICRFSPGPLPSSLSLLSTAKMKTNTFFSPLQGLQICRPQGDSCRCKSAKCAQ